MSGAARVMPIGVSYVTSSFTATDSAGRNVAIRVAVVALLHAAALGILIWCELDAVAQAAFVLTWGLLNFCWLVALRRPATAAALSLATFAALIVVSRFKYDALLMTASFIDVMIIDKDTVAFLMMIFPGLSRTSGIVALLGIPALIVIWWLDTFRIRRRIAMLGAVGCFAGLAGLSFAIPIHPFDEFLGANYVSKFARSGATAIVDYLAHGFLESDAAASGHLAPADGLGCRPAAKPPNIILVQDESSFDIRAVPGITVPTGYGPQFRSFDGKQREFVVETAGGASWFTEYNVLTGLSARSYGRFSQFLTRIATGRVERGLPHTLRKCGYKTFTLYPFLGAFLGARSFQATAGIQNFRDAKDLGMREVETDSFYFDAAARLIGREGGAAPLFLFVYTAANHFPWDWRFRPELTPDWRDPGNSVDIDEYLRRQAMSARDYPQFIERLRREFPQESFLVVRYGDHQPAFTPYIIDRSLDEAGIARRLSQFDLRYFTTYYAIDTVNYRPADLTAALDRLDAPYLPLVVLEAAGLPLDPSFAEQKRIFQRCRGLFYRCNGGAEARRFNRMLIDASLIKGL
jgi:phosphoglycerol transferase MdoB-like AlkP superfamily enzyme